MTPCDSANTATNIPVGIHVSSPWKLAHEKRRLQGCNTVVRACTSPNATVWGPTAVGGLIGKFPNVCIATYQNRSPTLADIRMDAGETFLKIVNDLVYERTPRQVGFWRVYVQPVWLPCVQTSPQNSPTNTSLLPKVMVKRPRTWANTMNLRHLFQPSSRELSHGY